MSIIFKLFDCTSCTFTKKNPEVIYLNSTKNKTSTKLYSIVVFKPFAQMTCDINNSLFIKLDLRNWYEVCPSTVWRQKLDVGLWHTKLKVQAWCTFWDIMVSHRHFTHYTHHHHRIDSFLRLMKTRIHFIYLSLWVLIYLPPEYAFKQKEPMVQRAIVVEKTQLTKENMV